MASGFSGFGFGDGFSSSDPVSGKGFSTSGFSSIGFSTTAAAAGTHGWFGKWLGTTYTGQWWGDYASIPPIPPPVIPPGGGATAYQVQAMLLEHRRRMRRQEDESLLVAVLL